MDFGQYAGQESKSPLVPGGTLAFVHINVRDTKTSPTTGSRYMDCELTILAPHQYADRKIYTKIADPMHEQNSDAYKQMGQNAICRILEVNGASPQNPAAYQIANIQDIHNKRGAIRIRVEEGEGGYSDKNEVGEWLTPNPSSKTGNKGWADLVAGNVLPKSAQPSAQGNMFAGQPAAVAQPTFLQGQQPAQQPASQPAAQPSWQQPAQQGAPAVNPQQPQPSTPAPAAGATWGQQAPATAQQSTASPSNPANPPAPAWLQQTQTQQPR
jgi:hypothetical protein